jgi:hypothetical protein
MNQFALLSQGRDSHSAFVTALTLLTYEDSIYNPTENLCSKVKAEMATSMFSRLRMMVLSYTKYQKQVKKKNICRNN